MDSFRNMNAYIINLGSHQMLFLIAQTVQKEFPW